MTFEKALEAMKQGKKVRRKSLSDDKIYLFTKDGKIMIHNPESMMCISRPAMLGVDLILADDWEIYEEKQKEPQMKAGHAIEVLESIRQTTSKSVIPDVDKAIDFAIECIDVLHKQTHIEYNVDLDSIREFEELQEKLKECKLEVNPEKKHECECKCNHTVEHADLQEEMKQALKDKFFELAKIEITEYDIPSGDILDIISHMDTIYKLLYL